MRPTLVEKNIELDLAGMHAMEWTVAMPRPGDR
jgi:hypothetical protein